MASTTQFGADLAWPLWESEALEGAFTLQAHGVTTNTNGVVKEVARPWLFGYKAAEPNGRAILILGGGGYVELMVGREGVAVAHWLTNLGFNAFVLVHRFPTAKTGAQAPVDDARRSLWLIEDSGLATKGLGLCGLSSGGHLAASLLASYPASWVYPNATEETPKPTFAIIGYGPLSTNAVGRTIIPDKALLAPPEKQELYNTVQPDVQLVSPAPPTFIVYSGNDPIVPVVNAYRLTEGVTQAGGVVELHVFADAPHGFGIDTVDLPVSRWPQMCEAWLKQNGLLRA
ncbi:alpha/beta-hydrolase [Cadophora sp. DSE1049]|nr:alpha/beta-hydrolase [Cadophora sp. DSE1049]